MNNTTCKNCGGDEALHHYQTDQCPVGGREAPLGRKQEWKSTTFEPVEDALIKMQKRAEASEARSAQLQGERDALSAQLTARGDYTDRLERELERVKSELAAVKASFDALKLEASKPWYNPALDEGDGVYRP